MQSLKVAAKAAGRVASSAPLGGLPTAGAASGTDVAAAVAPAAATAGGSSAAGRVAGVEAGRQQGDLGVIAEAPVEHQVRVL
jgi:hypothetical protein